MFLPQLAQFTDLSLLLLRLIVAGVFVTSGWTDFKDPRERAKSMGMTPAFTIFLGVAEVAGGLGVAIGVLTQLAAIGLILIIWGRSTRRSLFGTLVSGEKSDAMII
jgi:putative oxidoreductase